MYPYLAEFFGTTLFVFLALGTNASAKLNESLFKNAGPVYIIFGWGLAYALPALIFGPISGAYFNPVIPLSLAIIGKFSWSMVFGYIVVEFLGGFIGAWLTFMFYKDQIEATGDSQIAVDVFASHPAIPNMGQNFFCEVIVTFVFMIFMVTIPFYFNTTTGYFSYGIILMTVAYGLGGTTGFAVNPASDFAPRLMYQFMPIPDKYYAGWSYAIVPLLGPFVGGILGALVGNWFLTFPIVL